MANRLTKAVARALLDKLATDDAFRARFERDPRSALHEVGHDTPAGDRGVRGRDPVLNFDELQGGLASKETIAASTDSLMAAYDAPPGDAAGVGMFDRFTICATQ
jgi:putative modified peptide